ncbi:efflux RND transporter periplasmic adaptor subunit [Paralimibaculum aggregatum]|uniref:Efflux RND transporter periplasmic adaptor subunit n=1 Tax=Paralimibaculum aggregatum TaxID=3036245 RepID=A0ABQ6LM81_9RHOB|nr:efflux RND transporter periplasmic adaptor subunit [Limibaculum sp. NKW23]GMG81938.1 efflux RND transporter periplasmic adaptor subunit [Limibaculum sp. NKW23]
MRLSAIFAARGSAGGDAAGTRARPAPFSGLLGLAAMLAATGAAAQMPPNPPVDVAHPITHEVVDHDIFTGRFEAVKEVEIFARVSGYLDSISFEDGDVVEEGDLLFTIDQRTFKAAVTRAEAQVVSAEATRDLAQIERDRALQLAERNVGTTQEVDRTSAALAEAEAAVAVAKAQLLEAQLDLDFTEIRAPFTGRMSDTRIDEGNLVLGGSSGATLLSTIVSIDPIHFTFTASESDFLKYSRLASVGTRPASRVATTKVRVRLMDEDSFVHEGHMDFVDNRLDPNSGTITGRAVLDNSEGFLLPGLFGRLQLPASDPYEAVLIPDEAILADQASRIVMVVDAEGMVSPRPVKTGPMHGGLRVIREGLSTEDLVIVAGIQRARPGVSVTPNEITISFGAE